MNEIFSSFSILLTLYAYLPYAYSIHQGHTKPHVFSWLIWGITTFIVFLAQLDDNGGVGAWPLGLSGIITIYIAILAYSKKGDYSITTLDWWFLITALLSLPVWLVTNNPLWAVIILTTIDLLGFGPTIRKAKQYPHHEQASFYALFVIRNIFSVIALEHYSLTTVLFPIATGIACLWLVWIIWHGKKLTKKADG